METLIAKKKYCTSDRWYPKDIPTYKAACKIPNDCDENRRLRSNFAYSTQYIEYLEKQLDELKLSEVITKMLYKSYIITGMGIIELLFVYLLHSTNNWNRTEWDLIAKIPANPKIVNGEIVKIETSLYKKAPQHDAGMDFDAMIKRTESKGLLSLDHGVFPAHKKLRILRNRVHLQTGDNATDHDYNTIGLSEIQMMRRILYIILTCTEFCTDSCVFSFIYECYTKNTQR